MEGLWRGTVVAVVGPRVTIQVPRLRQDPFVAENLPDTLKVGQRVLVGPREGLDDQIEIVRRTL